MLLMPLGKLFAWYQANSTVKYTSENAITFNAVKLLDGSGREIAYDGSGRYLLSPGQRFYISFATRAWSCNNEPQDRRYAYKARYPNDGWISGGRDYWNNGVSNFPKGSTWIYKTVGSAIAPISAGLYNAAAHMDFYGNYRGTTTYLASADAVIPYTVIQIINGACGTANRTNVSSLPTGTAACLTGTYNADPTDTSGQYLWSCVGINGTNANCYANKTTEPPQSVVEEVVGPETVTNMSTWVIYGETSGTAPIVNSNEKCTIEWTIDSVYGGTCLIKDTNGNTVSDLTQNYSVGNNRLTARVNPQNEYTIMCTDNSDPNIADPNVFTSEVLRCLLNPVIIGQ